MVLAKVGHSLPNFKSLRANSLLKAAASAWYLEDRSWESWPCSGFEPRPEFRRMCTKVAGFIPRLHEPTIVAVNEEAALVADWLLLTQMLSRLSNCAVRGWVYLSADGRRQAGRRKVNGFLRFNFTNWSAWLGLHWAHVRCTKRQLPGYRCPPDFAAECKSGEAAWFLEWTIRQINLRDERSTAGRRGQLVWQLCSPLHCPCCGWVVLRRNHHRQSGALQSAWLRSCRLRCKWHR